MLRDSNPLIDLDPADWCWATWRKRPQLVRAEPQEFDRERILQQLKKAKRSKSGYWRWNACDIPVSMTLEEAKFWYQVIVRSQELSGVRDLVKHFQTEPLLDRVDLAEIPIWFASVESHYAPPQMMVILSQFLPLTKLLDQLVDRCQYELLVGFQRMILPYLDGADIETLQTHARSNWTIGRSLRVSYLMGLLGLHADFRDLVESWTSERYYYWYERECRWRAVFGLESAESVVFHARRLKLKLGTADNVRAWLAHTELSELDFIAESIAAINNNKEAQNAVDMFYALVRVRSPIVAPSVLFLTQKSRVSHLAQQWLETHLELSIPGLLPLTVQKHPLAEPAIAWLRMIQRQGYGDLIRQHMGKEYEQIELQIFDAPKLEEFNNTPAWLAEIAQCAGESLDWVTVRDLPAIVVDKTQLSKSQHQAVLTLLRTHPEKLSTLKQHATPDSLNQFVWQLYERWSLKQPKDKSPWVILALGHLGNDDTASKLASLIRHGCKASRHQLATPGMTALTLLGSDATVFELIRFAYQPISRLIQPFQALNEIAKVKHLSRRQLEDRAIVSFLQKHSTKLEHSENSKSPKVEDLGGRSRSKRSTITLSKTELKQFLKLQALRFEHQMIHEETYTVQEFESIAFHPLLLPMTQTLIWQGHDSTCFRITEDGSLADRTDSPLDLTDFNQISLPHPLLIPESASWTELLSDYELIPPFPQINRPTYFVSAEEQDGRIVTRFANRGVFTVNLTQSLMKLGWTETYIGRGRWRGFYKPFPSRQTVAILSCTDLPHEYSYYHIDRVFFVSNSWDRRRVPTDDDRIPLSRIDRLVFSEVLRELDHLTHRSRYA